MREMYRDLGNKAKYVCVFVCVCALKKGYNEYVVPVPECKAQVWYELVPVYSTV